MGFPNRKTTAASKYLRVPLAAYVLVALQVPEMSNGATTIHLKGRTRIEAHAARYSGEIALAGTAIDDTGMPASLPVTLTLSPSPGRGAHRANGQSDPPAATDVLLTTAAPESCSTDPRRPSVHPLILLESATRLVVPSDAGGKFCVRLLLPTDRYVAHFVAAPSPLLDGASLDLAFDVAARPVTLQFAGAQPLVAIDEDATAVDVLATTDADGTPSPLAGLKLHLLNETGTSVGDATTDAAGQGHFAVPAGRLGPAGRGEWRVTFDGSDGLGASASSVPVERRTHVRLLLPDAVGGVLPPGLVAPEDGVTVKVRAVEECAAHGCAGDPSGIVEARIAGDRAGASALVHGEAVVVLSFAQSAQAGGADARVPSVRFHYVPDAPWFLAGTPVDVLQPVRAPTPWGRIGTFVAGAGVLVWFVQARARSMVRAQRDRVEPPEGGRPAPAAPAARIVAGAADGGASGWRGVVVDAHDGHAVEGAVVSIERRSFERATPVASASSNSIGAFDLPSVGVMPGDQLTVRARLHANFRTPLPPQGTLEIAVTLRKRALIEGLALWARRKGGAYDLRPDATPGHVRLAAVARPDIARWAHAVEHAAFGPLPVDAQAQSSVDLLAPPDVRRAPQEEDAIGTDHVDGPRPRSV